MAFLYTNNDVVRVTLAYCDTFRWSRGCHCKRGCLYYQLSLTPSGQEKNVTVSEVGVNVTGEVCSKQNSVIFHDFIVCNICWLDPLPRTARFFLDCKSSSLGGCAHRALHWIGRRLFHPRNSIVVSGRLKYRNDRQVARGRDIKQPRWPGYELFLNKVC